MLKSRPVMVITSNETVTLPQRFWDKVNFTDTCWLWTGADSGDKKHPYGVSWNGDRRVKAHRWAFEVAFGQIPEGFEPDHLCRRTLCVRPSHMEAVTKLENLMRSDAPGPRAVRTNHCKRWHEFTPENTRPRRDGGRTCKECERMHSRATKARAKLRRTAA